MARSKKKSKPRRALPEVGEIVVDALESESIEEKWLTITRAGKAKAITAHKPVRKYKYIEELARLQLELIKLQEWIRTQGLRVVVIFEGRDAAGKGG